MQKKGDMISDVSLKISIVIFSVIIVSVKNNVELQCATELYIYGL